MSEISRSVGSALHGAHYAAQVLNVGLKKKEPAPIVVNRGLEMRLEQINIANENLAIRAEQELSIEENPEPRDDASASTTPMKKAPHSRLKNRRSSHK